MKFLNEVHYRLSGLIFHSGIKTPTKVSDKTEIYHLKKGHWLKGGGNLWATRNQGIKFYRIIEIDFLDHITTIIVATKQNKWNVHSFSIFCCFLSYLLFWLLTTLGKGHWLKGRANLWTTRNQGIKFYRMIEIDFLDHTGCQEINVTLPFECKIIMSPVLVTLWCCLSMEAGRRLCFSERSLEPVCMCCCASSTGSFVRALIYQRLQCHYGEGVHLFDTVQGCGSTWSG